jgi:hypothetical protein
MSALTTANARLIHIPVLLKYATCPTTCRIWTSDLSNLQEEYTGGLNLSVRVAKSVIGTPFTHWNILGFI